MTACPVVQFALRASKESPVGLEIEGYLGNQHEIGLMNGKDGLHRDEARVPAHELHKTDAVYLRMRLHVCRRNRLGGFYYRSIEAECLFDELDIVVDGLGNADHRNLKTSVFDFLSNGERSLLCAVTSNREQYIEIELFDRIHDLRGPIAAAARGAEHGPSNLVDIVDKVWIERHDLQPIVGQKPLYPY